MRPRKHPERSAVKIPAAVEEACPSAKAEAPAVGPAVSDAASLPLAVPDRTARPRLSVPDRQQLLSAITIDELLEADHPARAVWSYVQGLDLALLYDPIRARGSVAGRPAIDPRLLVALWLYATLSGFTSARELADLCVRHDAFRWLAGGVSVKSIGVKGQQSPENRRTWNDEPRSPRTGSADAGGLRRQDAGPGL